MSDKPTGGSAFPYEERDGDGKPVLDHFGMTLRDYFAVQALQGMLAHSTRYRSRYSHLHWHDAISQEAYEIADAMLQERKK